MCPQARKDKKIGECWVDLWDDSNTILIGRRGPGGLVYGRETGYEIHVLNDEQTKGRDVFQLLVNKDKKRPYLLDVVGEYNSKEAAVGRVEDLLRDDVLTRLARLGK